VFSKQQIQQSASSSMDQVTTTTSNKTHMHRYICEFKLI
jgi:hypothetical protein